MTKQTKLTLKDLIARKEAVLQSKKTKRKKGLFVKSLDGVITIESPSSDLTKDAQEMENGDEYLVYSCVVEPNLKDKELQQAYGCVEPLDIVNLVFEPGEIPQIAVECLKLAGYIDSVKAVEDIKN